MGLALLLGRDRARLVPPGAAGDWPEVAAMTPRQNTGGLMGQ